MKLGFVTCVELGFSCMKKIYELGYELEVAITLKDDLAKKKSGRVYIDRFCEEKELELIKIKNVNEQIIIDKINKKKLDWLFIIGWSQIAKLPILEAPRYGVIGMHPTLLPKGRGRASIPWAIIKGVDKTGVTAFKLDEGVDTGDIIDQFEIILSNNETAATLYEKVNKGHVALMESVLSKITDKDFKPVVQNNSEATIWPERKPQDGLLKIDMTVEEVDRLVRATTRPYPGAFLLTTTEKIIIWKGEIVSKENKFASDNLIKFHNGYYRIIESEIKKV